MDAIRSGKGGDAIVSLYPTSAYMSRPSFMEVNMTETLFPGFREAIAFLFPLESKRKVGKIFDVFHTFIETAHAFDRHNPCTASEKYLGFRRVRKNGEKSNLSFPQRIATIFESMIVPYLISRPHESDFEIQLMRAYKVLRAFLATLYIIGITDAISPIQYLMGIRLARVVPTGRESRTPLAQRIFSKLVWSLIYGIQLAQWYYSHESVLNPPNFRLRCCAPSANPVGLPADPSLCPLCFKTRANPTVLITTGHVYCYSCISRWLAEKGAVCPISGTVFPPASDQLHYIRRLV